MTRSEGRRGTNGDDVTGNRRDSDGALNDAGDSSRVLVHVHHAMTGTFPLRVADVCFTDDAVVIPEYAYLTPLFGIAGGKGQAAADTAREHIENGGLAALRQYANSTTELTYADVDSIRLHDGGRIGRPKLSIHPASGAPYGYRLHAPVDVDALASALESIGTTHDIDVLHTAGVGFSPRASLHRFLVGR